MNQRISQLEREREDMIDNFKLSSTVLLERLKDLEAQASGSMLGERPQTANVLSKISKSLCFYPDSDAEASGKRLGQARGRSRGRNSPDDP